MIRRRWAQALRLRTAQREDQRRRLLWTITRVSRLRLFLPRNPRHTDTRIAVLQIEETATQDEIKKAYVPTSSAGPTGPCPLFCHTA